MVFETIRVEHVYHPSCENWTQSMTNDHQWTKGYLVHSPFLRQCLAALNSIKQIGDLYTRDRKQQIDPQFRSFNSRACGSTKILNFEDQIHPCPPADDYQCRYGWYPFTMDLYNNKKV